jgi:uncharacterized membrane protein YebE (DUF533 family)
MSDLSELHKLAVAWTYHEQFGFSKPPSQTDSEVVSNMAHALLTAANGDGNLTAEEREWIAGYFAAKGYPEEVVAEARTLVAADLEAVPSLMQLGILRVSGRILVYDAIRAASVDGYDPGERRAVRAVARALELDDEVVAELEALVEEEAALRGKRIRLLMPKGHPNLHPRYQP